MKRLGYVTVLLLVMSLALPPSFGVVTAADKKGEHEGAAVKLEDVPAAAKATIEKEAKDGSIVQVTQDMEKGKAVYEAEIQKNGKSRFVSVSPEGKVVKRESARTEAKERQKESTK
jgi:hypothetical protein